MSRFFISYASQDYLLAERIRTNIFRLDSGHDVFLDRFGISIGANLRSTLSRRIESCDYFILILSQQALASKWVTFEVELAKKHEKKSGFQKLFVVKRPAEKIKAIPRVFAERKILDVGEGESFVADFFRLMNGIYQKPSFYEPRCSARNDPDSGYLVDLWLECGDAHLSEVEYVEYRFDNEFDYSEYNDTIIDGAVHVEENRQKRFRLKGLWTSESITVLVCVALKNTSTLYYLIDVVVGGRAN